MPKHNYAVIQQRSVWDCWCAHPDHPEQLWIGCMTTEEAAQALMEAHLEQKHGIGR